MIFYVSISFVLVWWTFGVAVILINVRKIFDWNKVLNHLPWVALVWPSGLFHLYLPSSISPNLTTKHNNDSQTAPWFALRLLTQTVKPGVQAVFLFLWEGEGQLVSSNSCLSQRINHHLQTSPNSRRSNESTPFPRPGTKSWALWS